MDERRIFELCEKFEQTHLLDHLRTLKEKEKSIFIENLKKVDFPLLNFLYQNYKTHKKGFLSLEEVEPPDVIRCPKTEEEFERQKRAKILGEAILREGKVACLLVAGGQATRLKTSLPKGFFPITPVKGKSFFQLFSEKILAISKKYGAEIPFLIMANPETKDAIGDFFKENNFFGLKKENVVIFEQETVPVLTKQGKLIVKGSTEILSSPNGHGNCIKRIYELGLIDKLQALNYKYLFYFQVDNPLVKIADPVFLGYHVVSGADVSIKVVQKKREDEKVGLYLKISGKPALVEYVDLSPDITSRRDNQQNLIFWAGNTAMHVFSLDFLERLNVEGISFPYHIAEKKIYIEGKELEVLKFETFVFDCLKWAEKVCAMEVLREEEFSPVKNREGLSSPETAKKDMSNLFKRWLLLCGIDLPEDVCVEISPLFALEAEDCVRKLKGKKLEVKKEIYIE